MFGSVIKIDPDEGILLVGVSWKIIDPFVLTVVGLKTILQEANAPAVRVTPVPIGSARSSPINPTKDPVVPAGTGFSTPPMTKSTV